MIRPRTASLIFACWGLLAPARVTAGLYSPAEKCPIPVRADGRAEELSFGAQKDGVFPQLLSELVNALDANPARATNPDRQRFLDLVSGWQKRPASALPPADVAGLGAALARVGRLDDAVTLLAPRGRDRTPDFRVLANLAHVHAARGEWRDALDWHVNAFDLAEFPDDLAGANPDQRKWLKKLERGEYRRWLQVHRDRATTRFVPEEAEPFPLFAAKFVNDRGVYEPGQLAAAERAKLPADAIPAVQQLVLWAPWDTDLYWLLAELYAADGRIREAEGIFNQCADGRQFANRRVFMAHRAAVRDAVAKLPPEKPADEIPLAPLPPPDGPTDEGSGLPPLRTVLPAIVAFAALALGLFVLQVRAASRRRRVRP